MRKKRDFIFAILHYLDKNVTIEAISSLEQTINKDNTIIVVYDNGSCNGSGEYIRNYYLDCPWIEIIISKTNFGFAIGNNKCYDFIRLNYEFRFITFMNNDVMITQKGFTDIINTVYEKVAFDVLGPDIYNPDSKSHQNPMRLKGLTTSEIKRIVKIRKKWLVAPFIWYHIVWVKNKLTKNRVINYIIELFSKKNFSVNYKKEMLNPVLHGACMIFSMNYLDKRDAVFDERTFLYFEEDILYYMCQVENKKIYYTPSLCVKHYEDVSTKAKFKKAYMRMKMKSQHQIESGEVLLSLMNSYDL